MQFTKEQMDELLRRMPMLPTPRARDGNCGTSLKGIIHNFKRGYLDGTIAVFLALLATQEATQSERKKIESSNKKRAK